MTLKRECERGIWDDAGGRRECVGGDMKRGRASVSERDCERGREIERDCERGREK